jgi:hypothetical protein
MNWRRNAAGFFFGTLLLVSCSTTPIPKANPPATPSDTTVRREWFWNPQWWLTNGPLVQEVKDTIAQNPGILATANRLNAQSNGGSYSAGFNIGQASQQWDPNSGLLTVTLPMASGLNPAFIYLAIRPYYMFFGPHYWAVEQVGYNHLQKVTIRTTSPNLPHQSVPGSSGNSNETVVNTMVSMNTSGALGGADSIWINPTDGSIVREYQTIHNASDSDVNTLINRNIGPAAVIICTNPGNNDPNYPPCKPDGCPPSGYLQAANIVASSCGPSAPPPPVPDCKKLRENANNARTVTRVATAGLVIAATGSVRTCIPALIGKKWTDVLGCAENLAKTGLALVATAAAGKVANQAESDYADNCAKP